MPVVSRLGSRLPAPRPPDSMLPAELHQVLLEQYAPPSLIVSADHTVVHLSPRAGRYLQLAGGEPSRDLLALVRQELRPDLRSALKRAMQDQVPVEILDVPVTIDNAARRVTITVRPNRAERRPGREAISSCSSTSATPPRRISRARCI